MSRHTPGPWWVAHHGEWIIGRSQDIGECLVAKTDAPEWRANALLIAAAPDLLAACLRLIEGADTNRSTLKREILEAIVMARAAIAKAKGDV